MKEQTNTPAHTNEGVISGKTDQKSVFIEMKAHGCSNTTIAKKLGVHRNTLLNWGKELDVKIAVHNAKSYYYEQLVEKHRLSHENKLEFLGKLKTKVEKSLIKKDFDKLPAKTLFDMSISALREMKTLERSIVYLERNPDVGGMFPINTRIMAQGEAKVANTPLTVYDPDEKMKDNPNTENALFSD